MIVTIDGPAGAGKSSIAKRLAERIGFEFLDTGAMYRAVTLASREAGLDLSDSEAVADLARRLSIQFDGDRVLLDGRDVSEQIRLPEISASIKEVADNVEVRRCMVAAQVEWGRGRNGVTEGRDQGTVAFPDAECKIFLTASPEVRARRRVQQLHAKGIEADYVSTLEAQLERDRQDESRPVGSLRRAEDAITLCTDGLTEEEVLTRLIEIVESKQEALGRPRIPSGATR